MSTLRHIILLLIGAALLGIIPVARGANWNSCARDLDALQSASEDASNLANEMQETQDNLENCRRFPNIYDAMKDHCHSAAAAYQGALSNLRNKLAKVASSVENVRRSCGDRPPVPKASQPAGRPSKSSAP